MIPENAKRVHKGPLFEVWQWPQERFDGTVATYEGIVRPDTVEAICVTEDGKIILQDQEQPHYDKPFVALPGGRVDPGEEPEQAMRRELMEETGFEVGEIVPWKEIRPSKSIDWTIYAFIARGCRRTGEQNLDAGERIQVRLVTLDEFLDEADKDGFRHRLIRADLVRAKYDQAARQQLERQLFSSG